MPIFLHLEGDGDKKKNLWVLFILFLHDDNYNANKC